MKKLIGLFILLILSVGLSFGQTATAVSKTFTANQTYYEYTPSSDEYIGGENGYDTLYFEIMTNKSMPVVCNARVEVASRKGTTDVYDMDLQGKIFANGTYAAIIESASNTASKELLDTTSYKVRPNKFYRYYRVIVNDDNNCATTDSLVLSKVIFKIYEADKR